MAVANTHSGRKDGNDDRPTVTTDTTLTTKPTGHYKTYRTLQAHYKHYRTHYRTKSMLYQQVNAIYADRARTGRTTPTTDPLQTLQRRDKAILEIISTYYTTGRGSKGRETASIYKYIY